MTWALVGLPAATAVLALGSRRSGLASLAALLGALATTVVAALALAEVAPTPASDPFADNTARPVPGGGYPFGDLDLPLTTALSPTSALLALLVAVIVLAVQTYAVWSLGDDDRRRSFHATVALFAAAMLLLVVSSDLVLTLVGWEVMGWCSYLLIGHWSRREAPRRAAHKAFLVTRLADVALVLGVTLLVAEAGSTARAAVLDTWTGDEVSPALRSTALALVVIGVLGKSAQLPFQDWLADAMAGPTPASALIHAATMVAAGTVLLAQLLPLLLLAEPARLLLVLSAGLTMVLAALLALLQRDLKRMLAWSTVSQVSLMLLPLAAAGAGVAAGAALLHLYAHAIAKALLFLTLGWLVATRGGTGAERLVGAARQHRAALAGWVLGLASIAGVPLLVGGVSKERIIASVQVSDAPAGSGPVLVAILLSAVLTAGYATRALLVATADPASHDGTRQQAVMPRAVALVLLVLTALTVIGGWVLVDDALPEAAHAGLPLIAGVVVLVLLGAALGWLVHADPRAHRLVTGRVGDVAAAGLHADRAYRLLVGRPVLALSGLVRFLDREVLESYVHAVGWGAQGTGGLGERSQRRGRPATGVLLVGAGALLVVTLGVIW